MCANYTATPRFWGNCTGVPPGCTRSDPPAEAGVCCPTAASVGLGRGYQPPPAYGCVQASTGACSLFPATAEEWSCGELPPGCSAVGPDSGNAVCCP
jgi:hypothetical protein